MAATQQIRKFRVRADPAVEVGAQRAKEHYTPLVVARRAHEPLEELAPLSLRLADGEQLLQLVDGHHDPGAVVDAGDRLSDVFAERPLELLARMTSGPQQDPPPAGAARQRPRPQRRQHARAQQRGLADPRRPGYAHQRPLGQPRHEL